MVLTLTAEIPRLPSPKWKRIKESWTNWSLKTYRKRPTRIAIIPLILNWCNMSPRSPINGSWPGRKQSRVHIDNFLRPHRKIAELVWRQLMAGSELLNIFRTQISEAIHRERIINLLLIELLIVFFYQSIYWHESEKGSRLQRRQIRFVIFHLTIQTQIKINQTWFPML